MKILNSDTELKSLLSVTEIAAYLGDTWCKPEQQDLTSDEIRMEFDSPSCGTLHIKAGHKAGENNFVIKFSTHLQVATGDEDYINRQLTLVGDATTGIITALLSELEKESNRCDVIIPELNWSEIQNSLQSVGEEAVWQLQKEGFKAFSAKEVTIPEVIYLPFKGYGDLHLKGAHKKAGDIFVFKIATGFPGNKAHNLQPSQGMMLAFDARTATPLIILRDEGHLTDLRTAIAGRNAAEEMMSAEDLIGIGVLGTGVQARLQIGLLKALFPHCNKLTVWGHTEENTIEYAKEMTDYGWDVTIVDTPGGVAEASNLIITTTPSEIALLDASDIEIENTLIIAIGADMPGKVELSPALLKKADSVLIDSISQGKDHGNAAIPIKDGVINETDLQEFGDYLFNGFKNPDAASGLKIFLSSGIGVQDLQIVQAVIAGSH